MPRHSHGVLAALAILTALAFQGTRGLFETSEGRYAEVAREMRESGNYLEPTLAYRPHWTKPPLTYWAIAGGLATAGNNPWGVRAYNVVAFALTVLAVAAIGTALWNPQTGFLAGLVYLSSPYPALAANVTTADTLLALWETLAVLAYVRAWKGAQSGGWVRLMWVMFGLGFFTKGPPALLPLLAIVAFHGVARRPFRLADPAGLLLFVVTGFWWYGLMVFRHPELSSYFIGSEIVARNVSDTFSRNGQWYGAFAVYVPVLVFGPGAWLVDGVRIVRSRRLYAPKRLIAAWCTRGTAGSFLLYWFLLPLAAFMLSKSRLHLYVLPLYAAIALAIGRGIVLLSASGTARRRDMRVALASVAVVMALKVGLAYWPSEKNATRFYHEAVRVAGSDAHFVLFREPKFFGFQFHAGKDLERITPSGAEPWADRRLDDALATRATNRPYAIVTMPPFAPELERALAKREIHFARQHVTGRDVFVIPAR